MHDHWLYILEWEYYPSQCIFTVIFTRKDGGPVEKNKETKPEGNWMGGNDD